MIIRSVRILGVLLICLCLAGCLGLFRGKLRTLTPEEAKVEYSINSGLDKLWKAAVLELRNVQILEADEANSFIKAADADVIIEFKAKSKDSKHSWFSVKAYNLEDEGNIKIARKFAKRIYKKARSFFFSVGHLMNKDLD